MKRTTVEIRNTINKNMADARKARKERQWDVCWSLLEDAHIVSQPWAWPHMRVHAAMLVAGWRARDSREVRGQMLRLLFGGPASVVGRYPTGNTGRARESAIQPMPMRADLAGMLARAGCAIN
jgi:hypothetical protein